MERYKDKLILIKDSKETSHHIMRNQNNQAKQICNLAKEKYLLSVITKFPQTIKHLEAAQTPIHSKLEVPPYHSNKLGIRI